MVDRFLCAWLDQHENSTLFKHKKRPWMPVEEGFCVWQLQKLSSAYKTNFVSVVWWVSMQTQCQLAELPANFSNWLGKILDVFRMAMMLFLYWPPTTPLLNSNSLEKTCHVSWVSDMQMTWPIQCNCWLTNRVFMLVNCKFFWILTCGTLSHQFKYRGCFIHKSPNDPRIK